MRQRQLDRRAAGEVDLSRVEEHLDAPRREVAVRGVGDGGELELSERLRVVTSRGRDLGAEVGFVGGGRRERAEPRGAADALAQRQRVRGGAPEGGEEEGGYCAAHACDGRLRTTAAAGARRRFAVALYLWGRLPLRSAALRGDANQIPRLSGA